MGRPRYAARTAIHYSEGEPEMDLKEQLAKNEAELARIEEESAALERRRPLQGLGGWTTGLEKGKITWDEFIEKMESAARTARELRDEGASPTP